MKIFSTVLAGAVILGGVGLGAQALAKNNDEDLKYVYEAELVHANEAEKQGKAKSTGTEITMSEATEIALSKVENGVITEVEKDREKGQVVYEIEVKTDEFEYEFKINEQDGKIIKEEQEKRNKKHRTNDQPSKDIISSNQATEIALKEVPGTMDDIELERENGLLIYEVEIENEADDDADVYIDAVTGEVLYVEWDD